MVRIDMKKALIDPTSVVSYVSAWQAGAERYTPVVSPIPNSCRVAEIADADFPVALPLYWADCADDVVADVWYLDSGDSAIKLIPPAPPVPAPTADQNKAKAERLLAETDWVNQPDVIDPNVNPHLLNHADFTAYRAALRTIAVNPQPGVLVWPTKPQEQWS
jgi:hypothetical protein